jgi:hypothetical protein
MPIGPMTWTEFALDSPLEGGGFEPSVPRRNDMVFEIARSTSLSTSPMREGDRWFESLSFRQRVLSPCTEPKLKAAIRVS